MHWSDHAACKGWPTELFYIDRHDKLRADIEAVCEGCPVRAECLDWALHHEHYGYWGGMSERKRRKLRSELEIRFSLPIAVVLGRR